MLASLPSTHLESEPPALGNPRDSRRSETALAVDYRPISGLIPYARNARTHSEAQVALIAGSIREFGFTNPVLVDGDERHHRRPRPGAGGAQARARRGAGDRARPPERGAEAGATSWPTTSSPSGPAGTASCSRSSSASSRSSASISARSASRRPRSTRCSAATLPDPREEETPEPPAVPVSRPGDLWLLGPHRLLCGGATDPADVARLLGGVRPQLMVTDPPYGVAYDPAWRNQAGALGDQAHRQGAERRPGRLARGLGAVPRRGRLCLARRAARGHGRREPRGLRLRHPQPDHLGEGAAGAQPRRLPLAARALLVRGAEGGKGHWTGDRKQTTLWQIPSRDQDAATVHGTQKPVEGMRRPMLNNSSPGQAVYEPFLGSGTSVIAAETCGRICARAGARPGLCRCRRC